MLCFIIIYGIIAPLPMPLPLSNTDDEKVPMPSKGVEMLPPSKPLLVFFRRLKVSSLISQSAIPPSLVEGSTHQHPSSHSHLDLLLLREKINFILLHILFLNMFFTISLTSTFAYSPFSYF